ncbi:hypothetical protein MKS88_001615 [Plasmodium brasilianum]|uniref:Uncharacterized protein n=2 Tax=Plasmodium (Plasmodium) TaxID=418103 RepID=A0A1A8W0L4_PLAMA|nr:conserved Plasmodium protein, unknown function [Plasmodium malariae]KAI4839714.1 hypothetical protein MKS88_001615 [Plasmodium brasilianum]SBS86423.1 conserved Plasmodium protein, unknown function [Plasmodium malariae]SBT86656.1 conserved Plasmodium protein, unknown function [Plasmodium malariae]
MNLQLFKNKKLSSDMYKTKNESNLSKEQNEAIIVPENKRIVLPSYYNYCIMNSCILTILSTVDTRYINVINANSKNASNLFSLRKKTQSKNKKGTYKSSNNKDRKHQYDKTSVCENCVGSYNSIQYKNNIKHKSLKNICFEGKMPITYSNLENTNTGKVNENLEYVNYFMYNAFKNEHMNTVPKSKNSNSIVNNPYPNRIQMTNYSGIKCAQFNKKIANSQIRRENNEILKNNTCIMTEHYNLKDNIKFYNDSNIKLNKNLGDMEILHINYEDKSKKNQCLSLTDYHKKDIEKSVKQNNEIDNGSSQHFSIFHHVNPLFDKKIKKQKKNYMGACFLSLNSFSCQFLMSCDKT